MTNTTTIDPTLFRSTMGRFVTGVTVVTVSEQHAMTANAFLSVSLDPPLVRVSIGKRTRMHTYLSLGSCYGINILAQDQEDYSRHFAGKPVAGLKVSWINQYGPPLIDGCVAHIVARVVNIHSAGDHILYIGHVEYLCYWERRPLLFFSGTYSYQEPLAL
jgi:flavin reductase (DIM6/NTAB) family NADH-FMN oxidoreductase RutF